MQTGLEVCVALQRRLPGRDIRQRGHQFRSECQKRKLWFAAKLKDNTFVRAFPLVTPNIIVSFYLQSRGTQALFCIVIYYVLKSAS